MKPLHKRLGRSLSPKPLLGQLFSGLEDASPAISRFLRYHSRIHLISPEESYSTINRPVRVTGEGYREAYATVLNGASSAPLPNIINDTIPIHTALIENLVIHGHIKAPIDPITGAAVAYYFPHSRVAWGDVFPLPFAKQNRIEGDVIFIPRLTNIFHLLVEHIIPAVAAVIRYRSEIRKKITIVSQVNFPLLAIFTEFLNEMGFDAHLRIIGILDEIKIERLVTSRAKANDADFNYAYSEEMSTMGEFLDEKTKKISVPDFCYIERSQTPRRNILNQQELIQKLSEKNIKNITFTFQNFLTQIAVFRKSKIILSAHGAALTNIAFSTPRQIVVEIFSQNLRPKCYINMASQHRIKYHAIIGSTETGNENFSIPTELIESTLQKISY
jgi:hypothetical protein